MDWYAARILTGKERIIQFYMDRENIEVFFPTAVELRPGHLDPVTVRIFPGYAFFRFDLDADHWECINNTHGVLHLLPVKNEIPLYLPRAKGPKLSFVDDLKLKIMNGGFSPKNAEDLTLGYCPGDMVPIVAGTFGGFEGKMVKSTKNSMVLLLSLFGREMQVPILKTDIDVKQVA